MAVMCAENVAQAVGGGESPLEVDAAVAFKRAEIRSGHCFLQEIECVLPIATTVRQQPFTKCCRRCERSRRYAALRVAIAFPGGLQSERASNYRRPVNIRRLIVTLHPARK